MSDKIYLPTKEQVETILNLIENSNDSNGTSNQGSLNAKLNNLINTTNTTNTNINTANTKITTIHSILSIIKTLKDKQFEFYPRIFSISPYIQTTDKNFMLGTTHMYYMTTSHTMSETGYLRHIVRTGTKDIIFDNVEYTRSIGIMTIFSFTENIVYSGIVRCHITSIDSYGKYMEWTLTLPENLANNISNNKLHIQVHYILYNMK